MCQQIVKHLWSQHTTQRQLVLRKQRIDVLHILEIFQIFYNQISVDVYADASLSPVLSGNCFRIHLQKRSTDSLWYDNLYGIVTYFIDDFNTLSNARICSVCYYLIEHTYAATTNLVEIRNQVIVCELSCREHVKRLKQLVPVIVFQFSDIRQAVILRRLHPSVSPLVRVLVRYGLDNYRFATGFVLVRHT